MEYTIKVIGLFILGLVTLKRQYFILIFYYTLSLYMLIGNIIKYRKL